jgi:hypothetical protein
MKFLFEKVKTSFIKRITDEVIKTIFQKKSLLDPVTNEKKKSHHWRLCPVGEHWVKPHTKKLASGKITNHDGHCRKNPKSRSEFYTADELIEMADRHFDSLAGDKNLMPVAFDLGYANGNKYDKEIAGWTKFWNDIFQPEVLLDSNLVKALIATESSFILPGDQKSKDGAARGLVQITENTRKILQDVKGELRNHHLKLSIEETRISTANIAAGVRWLHHKKFLAEYRLKRKVTWQEAIAEYKGILDQVGEVAKTDTIMDHIEKHYQYLNMRR